MSDASLRELERAEDPASRLRLATLARAGQIDEALAALDLSVVPADVYPAAHELSERLWRAHVARLRSSVAIPARGPRTHALDWTERWVAWTELDRPGLRVAPLVGGPATNVIPDHPPHEPPIAFRGGFYAQREGELTFVRLEPELAVERHVLEPGDEVQSWSSSGERVLLTRNGREGIYAWPSLAPVLERPRGVRLPRVDWDLELLFTAPSEDVRVELHGFRSHSDRQLSIPEELLAGAPFSSLGRGVLVATGAGLVIFGVRRGWWLDLIDAQDLVPSPDLALDGRGLRLLLGGKIVRFEVDLDAGRVLAAPGVDLAALTQEDFRRPAWHPRADLAARSTSSGVEVIGTDARWEGLEDPDWIDGGRALVARRRDHGGLEVLRARDRRAEPS